MYLELFTVTILCMFITVIYQCLIKRLLLFWSTLEWKTDAQTFYLISYFMFPNKMLNVCSKVRVHIFRWSIPQLACKKYLKIKKGQMGESPCVIYCIGVRLVNILSSSGLWMSPRYHSIVVLLLLSRSQTSFKVEEAEASENVVSLFF